MKHTLNFNNQQILTKFEAPLLVNVDVAQKYVAELVSAAVLVAWEMKKVPAEAERPAVPHAEDWIDIKSPLSSCKPEKQSYEII